jgi:hypothetical protein
MVITVEAIQPRQQASWGRVVRWVLGAWAGANILFMVFLWFNHARFPLHLDLMEGTVLQHLQRAVALQPIYPEPTPEYVPLAYNVLYYMLAAPFAWLFGTNLFTLRLVAILGMAGSGLILYRVVQERTRSRWWGLMAAGLFAAAYRVMDTYLDNAHSDSWLLCSALLGSYILDRNRSRLWNLAGVAVLVASFWFKQHGALFAIGGVLFLTWREGLRRSLPYWLAAAILGPISYVIAGPWLFGSHFLYFTWEVPRRWSELHLATLRRYAGFVAKSYPLLALSGTLVVIWYGLRKRAALNVWHVQFVMAALTGFMGTLDFGSANNIFIPMGTWFILLGTLGLHEFATRFTATRKYPIYTLAFVASFALLVYNPFTVIVSPRADAAYADLIGVLRGLDGHVYGPSLGQLENGYTLYPAAHWVALEDMIRGPGRDTTNHPTTRRLLDPVINPEGPAYILTNYPLDVLIPALAFLTDYYVLETDYGERFQPLRVLPKRWNHGWPRYLYRYEPKAAAR